MKKTTSSPPFSHGLAPLALCVALAAPGFPLAAMANGTSPAGTLPLSPLSASFSPTRATNAADPTTSTANLDLSTPTYRADATTHATSAANPAANAANASTNAQTSATSSQNSAQLPPTDAPSKAQTVLHFTVTRQDTNETLIGAAVRCQGVLAVTDNKGQCTIRLKNNPGRVHVEVTYIGCHKLVRTLTVPADGRIALALKDASQEMQSAVVTTQRKHTSVLQQSAAVKSADIEKGGAMSLAKLLETIPGVSSISTGGTIAKPVIQGMHSSRILLMNNGVRLESQSWGADHAPEVDYTGSSMVEVVKGAECIRYGFGAMGGVVLLNDAPLPYDSTRFHVKGSANLGYDTNARGVSGSGTLEAGYKRWGARVHGNYTKGGDYRTADYILNNTGYNNIALSAMLGYKDNNITATLLSSIYYQRSGIYYGSKISDLDQLMKRFEAGRPDPTTLRPFSYDIQPPFQQSQHFTVKGELKWRINPDHRLDFVASFQENLRQEFENRKKQQWSWIPMQDLILKTFKFDATWNAQWHLWHMTTEAGLANTYQENFNYPGTKQPAFVPNFAALSMGGFALHKATFGRLQAALGLRYDFRVMSVNGYTSLSNYTYYDDFKLYSNFTSSLAAHYQISEQWEKAPTGWWATAIWRANAATRRCSARSGATPASPSNRVCSTSASTATSTTTSAKAKTASTTTRAASTPSSSTTKTTCASTAATSKPPTSPSSRSPSWRKPNGSSVATSRAAAGCPSCPPIATACRPLTARRWAAASNMWPRSPSRASMWRSKRASTRTKTSCPTRPTAISCSTAQPISPLSSPGGVK